MRFNSIKFKVGNLFTIILGTILVLYSGFLQFSLSRYLINDLDEDLSAKVNEIGNIISEELAVSAGDDVDAVIRRIFSFQYPPKSSIAAVKKKRVGGGSLSDEEKWFVRFDRLDLSQDMVAFFESNGRLVFPSQNIPSAALEKFRPDLRVSDDEDVFRDVLIHKKHFRQVQSVIPLPNDRRLFVLIASSEKPILDLLRHRQWLFVVSIPVVLLLTAFLGRLLAERILRPVNDIVSAARQISSRDLSRRISQEKMDEEMKILADSFNDMIARLEDSFKHIEQFSSQVAHELKTPLAILRGETEVALRANHSVLEYREVLRENLEEIEKITKIIEDLLFLAKLDYHPDSLEFRRIDFNEFFSTVAEKTRLLAEEKDIRISSVLPSENVEVEADALHLRRLFFNIIHNAIKFTPPGGKVSLEAFEEDGRLKIRIADEGPGIPQEYLPRIFDRFFQVPGIGESVPKGSGLGLNIAQSIAKAHLGTIEVQSRIPQGTVFTIILPLAS